jgi:transposase-like protein
MARPKDPDEFRQQLIALVRAGRTPESLVQEFAPSAQTIRHWLEQADLGSGRQADGLTTDERAELVRLRRATQSSCSTCAPSLRARTAPTARRACSALRNIAIQVGQQRVARVMRLGGLGVGSRQRGAHTTRRGPAEHTARDLVQRPCAASAPNPLWVVDITDVPTWAGVLDLVVVLDVWRRAWWAGRWPRPSRPTWGSPRCIWWWPSGDRAT